MHNITNMHLVEPVNLCKLKYIGSLRNIIVCGIKAVFDARAYILNKEGVVF